MSKKGYTKPNLIIERLSKSDPELINNVKEYAIQKIIILESQEKMQNIEGSLKDDKDIKKIFRQINRLILDDLKSFPDELAALSERREYEIMLEEKAAIADHILKEYNPDEFNKDQKLKDMVKKLLDKNLLNKEEKFQNLDDKKFSEKSKKFQNHDIDGQNHSDQSSKKKEGKEKPKSSDSNKTESE